MEQAEPAAPPSPNELVYTIRQGDTWWGLAERFYGDGAQAEELLQANIGRPQDDGRQITRRGFIYPGWTVRVTGASRGIVEENDGQRWYTVAHGDTLSGIAGTVLGDEARWHDLFELNRGQARLDEQHVLEDASLIWPGLVLQLPADNPAPGEEASAGPPPPAQPEPVAAPPATPLPTVQAPVESPSITAIATPAATVAAPSSSPVVDVPVSEIQPPKTSDPAAAPISGELVEIGGIAAGLGVAVWLALKSRSRRPPPPPSLPETDTELDEHAFTRAAPAAVLAARRDGGDDPHGIVLGELLAGELLNRAHRAGLREVQLVAVAAGRSSSQLSFSAPLHDRPLLEATLRASGDLARRVVVSRSEDQDVVVRHDGLQRHVLVGARLDENSPVLLCLGLHMDGRACLAGWEALGHVVIATQPGTDDALEHAAALVATLKTV